MIRLTVRELGRVHLVGCGGVGMSGLAELLLRRGIPVSGSELRPWPVLDRLRELGGTVYTAHRESNVAGSDTVVYSTAVPSDHVEIAAARRAGLRVLHRSEALAAAMEGYRAIAVAGTHGKTSTTAMTVGALRHSSADPSYVVGGEMYGLGAAAAGSSGYFVVEADESDRSLLHYRSHAAIVTNIDSDHMDTYDDLDTLQETFAEFCRGVEPGGFVVTCADDARCRSLAETLRSEGMSVHTYGVAPDADLRVSFLPPTGQQQRYLAFLDGQQLGAVTVPVLGRHLALDSAAALLTALRLGMPAESVLAGLARYPGVRRRFELKGVADDVRVYDDYACHHTAMAASLHALRRAAGNGRLIAVCQPCRTYRVRDFRQEMADALGYADQAVVLEVYGPGERSIPGADGAALAAAVPLPSGDKAFVGSHGDVPAEVARRARPGDLVATLGAPGMSMVADDIVAALGSRSGSTP